MEDFSKQQNKAHSHRDVIEKVVCRLFGLKEKIAGSVLFTGTEHET